MIEITSSAQHQISSILSEEDNSKLHLRIFVQGGGCSGFQYGFTLDDEIAEDDMEIPILDTTVLVDTISLQYLTGSVVDYKDDLNGSRFSITNPQAQSTCGCGSSFSI